MTAGRTFRFALRVLVTLATFAAPGSSAGAQPTGSAGEARKAVRGIIEQAAKGAREARVPRSLPADVAASVDAWVVANRAALTGLKPSPLIEQPWGMTAVRAGGKDQPSLLYLYVFDWHVGGELTMYGMTSRVKRAHLLKDAAKAELPFALRGRSTVLTVPKDAPDPLATVVVVEVHGETEPAPTAIYPEADGGGFRLHGRDAMVHGRTLRYEPQPLKNTLGYWTDPADWVSWQIEVTKPGKFTVEILQGCGKGSGGSKVNFAVADQILEYTVEDTGGFQKFVTRKVGEFRFDKPGRYTLSVKPTHKAGVAVMDLREIKLTPVKE